MAFDGTKTVVGTVVGGFGISATFGVGLIAVSAFVGLATLFVGIPVMLYLAQNGRVEPDRVLKAGPIFGIGLFLLAAITLPLFAVLGIAEFHQFFRVAAIPVFGYLVATRV